MPKKVGYRKSKKVRGKMPKVAKKKKRKGK